MLEAALHALGRNDPGVPRSPRTGRSGPRTTARPSRSVAAAPGGRCCRRPGRRRTRARLSRAGRRCARFLPGLSKQHPRLVSRLQVDAQAHGDGVLEDHLEPGDGLSRRLALVVPDRRKRGPDVVLVKVLDRHPSELRQHMECQRREPPARLSVALELRLAGVEASCATCASVGRSAAASRLSRSRSRIGSRPLAATLRQRSASVRAAFSETSVSEPSPFHAGGLRPSPATPIARRHRGAYAAIDQPPSLYLPGGRLLICTAVNRCMARIFNPPFHPPWSVRCTDTRGNLTQATDMSILCKFSRLGRMGLGRHGNSMPTAGTIPARSSMTIFKVRHVTTYRYRRPVASASTG